MKNSKLLSSHRTNHSSPSTGLLLLTLKIQVLCPHIERSVKINIFFSILQNILIFFYSHYFPLTLILIKVWHILFVVRFSWLIRTFRSKMIYQFYYQLSIQLAPFNFSCNHHLQWLWSPQKWSQPLFPLFLHLVKY